MSNKTPKDVAEKATQRGVLTDGEVTLLGIAGAGLDRRILIRLPSGSIIKAEPGKPSRAGTIVGISDSQVVLRRGGKDVTLTIPN